MDIGGFMICRKATSSRYACDYCRQRVEVSDYGKIRMQEAEQTGQRLVPLCNECGGKAAKIIFEMSAARPDSPGATLEILPEALEQIADRDKELAKQLFRRDAERREQEAKEKKP